MECLGSQSITRLVERSGGEVIQDYIIFDIIMSETQFTIITDIFDPNTWRDVLDEDYLL